MKKFLPTLICLVCVAAVTIPALNMDAGERRKTTGTQYGISATDPIAFHGATPVPMPSAAAQATVVPVASATVSPTAVPTLTPANTPVGSDLNTIVAQLNLLTAKVNQLVADDVANTTLVNRLQKDLKDQGLIKGGP